MNEEQLKSNILNSKLKFPHGMSDNACLFILKVFNYSLEQLVEKKPEKRLGFLEDAKELKADPWFKDLNWQDVYEK